MAVAISILSIVIAGSNFLAYGTTQRVANRLGAATTGRRRRRGCPGVLARRVHRSGGRSPAGGLRRAARLDPRCERRGAPVRDDLSPDLGDRRSVRARRPRSTGNAAWCQRLPITAGRARREQRRQRRGRGRAGVRLRPRGRRSGVVDRRVAGDRRARALAAHPAVRDRRASTRRPRWTRDGAAAVCRDGTCCCGSARC